MKNINEVIMSKDKVLELDQRSTTAFTFSAATGASSAIAGASSTTVGASSTTAGVSSMTGASSAISWEGNQQGKGNQWTLDTQKNYVRKAN